ncbi:hypothetical protein GVX81_11335 [[Haemophilus] felis]|nr:hypothetical protein [[Haemophilus] felis]NBI41883.1 hypothetical protein [[Haemophilus] felis]NBI44004.1 hypothetical protein [[Haemophilus] felis]
MKKLIQMLGAAIGGGIYLLFAKDALSLTNSTKWFLAIFLILFCPYIATYIYDRFYNK